MGKRIDKSGFVFGEWTVLHRHAGDLWMCRCSCGVTKPVTGSSLVLGKSTKCRSCGTAQHGQTGKNKTRIYSIWEGMKRRCQNPNVDAYKDYGGRGIKVCEKWQNFEGFYEDMGDAPESKTLGRINNDGDYELNNVQWEDWKQQNRNRRTSSTHIVNGVSKTIAEWAEIKGMPPRQLRLRMTTNGLTMEQALAIPYKPYRKRVEKV